MPDVSAELDRIGKIMACLDSPHEGEAVAALRLARARLAALGLTIADWHRLQAATRPIFVPPPAPATNRAVDHWQRIAAETADKLWQLGQELYALGLDKQLDTASVVKTAS